jgi:hypothetical protein
MQRAVVTLNPLDQATGFGHDDFIDQVVLLLLER